MAETKKIIISSCACTGANLPRFVQPTLLQIISQESLHGYAIMQKLAESGLFSDLPPDAAGVYRLLNNMENDGSLESFWDTSESGPARKCYRITTRGRECLDRWRATLKDHQKFIGRLISFCE